MNILSEEDKQLIDDELPGAVWDSVEDEEKAQSDLFTTIESLVQRKVEEVLEGMKEFHSLYKYLVMDPLMIDVKGRPLADYKKKNDRYHELLSKFYNPEDK